MESVTEYHGSACPNSLLLPRTRKREKQDDEDRVIDPDVDRKEKQRALKSEERFGSAAFRDYN